MSEPTRNHITQAMGITPSSSTACGDTDHVAQHDEVLSQTQRTLVLRRHLPDGRCVVLKQAFGADAQARLRHEGAILARLNHIPGVVHLVPEHLPGALTFQSEGGVTLSQWMRTEAPGTDAIVTLAMSLAQTLSAVHLAGVIHKDINPSNILLEGPERRAVLIDFHIASCFAEERQGFTHQSHIAGTLAYMSPEQTGRTGRAIDQRSDLYALGVTLYELAVGHRPFESDDMLEMIHDHLVRLPVPPAQIKPSIPLALSDIVMRLLEKEADRRYQTADGLCRDLIRLRQRLDEGLGERSFPLGEDDFPLRLTPPSVLIGRQAEVQALQEAVDNACRAEGRSLLVAGEPGVGKSVLINELQPMITARRGWFVSGKFEQYQRDVGSAFVQALRALGRLLLAEPDAALQHHRERILKALGANAGLGPSLLPELSLLLGPLPKVKIDDPVEAETRMLQATVDVLRSVVSPEQPLVMVVDDLQWAPAISLRLLDALVTLGHELPGLLLIGAYRVNEVDASHPLSALMSRWGQLGVSPDILKPSNLPAGDICTLIGEMLRLPEREAHKLGTAIHARTGGNPCDTVELINALRQDGLLTPHSGSWQWSDAAIRQYVGDCDVLGLLGRRIDKMPRETQDLMAWLACLGGEQGMSLMQVASGLTLDALDTHLAPALEDGLIVAQSGHERQIRFRHDRVQQAMHERMQSAQSKSLVELILARRLAPHPELSALAAMQYLPMHEQVEDETEVRLVIQLFRKAASANKVVDFALCERFLRAAIALSTRLDRDDADEAQLLRLHTDHHAVLYGLARLDEADAAYEIVVRGQPDLLALVDAAAVQIASLGNRQRHKEAVALGLALLEQLGIPQPEDIKAAIGMGLFKMAAWIASPDKAQDLDRPELSDPHLLAQAKLLSKTQTAAFFCASKIVAWLTIESHRLWVEHGPCPALMATLSTMPMQLIAIAEDFEGAHQLGRHLLLIGEKRRYEPTTSAARFLFANYVGHWFEPIDKILIHFHRAREGLFQAGDLQYGIFTFASWILQFEKAPSIDFCLDDVQAAFTVSARTGDQNFLQLHRPARQLCKALTGQITTQPWGGFSDDEFDEAAHEAAIATLPIAGAYYHVERALSAAIFDDAATLQRHASAAMPLQKFAPGSYIAMYAHVLSALALAEQLRTTPDATQPQPQVLADLDKRLKWIRQRAKDAPFNFRHLQLWIEAERAWAVGEFWGATAGFNAAMNEAKALSRPLHRALITERAARFQLSQGIDNHGHPLMQSAHDLYAAWGARAKVARLCDEFPDLRHRRTPQSDAHTHSTIVSTDMVDVLSVLRASQALSSETSLARLNSRVSKVLISLTGAASVQMVVRAGHTHTWQVLVPEGHETRMVTLEDAAGQGLLPLSAFQYAERTREPLLLTEATRDDRFRRDPYFKGISQCSMLLLPVLSKGDVRAMLVLENRLTRGAFSSDRLDAVALIAGQLSVSLDNALLYASLEQKVADRTAALEAANQRLELLSATDALTGVANRRKFNEALDAEWLRAMRTRQAIGLVLIDIDHFKLYNDHHGHQGGDACLQMVASTLSKGLRAGNDLFARYGGEVNRPGIRGGSNL